MTKFISEHIKTIQEAPNADKAGLIRQACASNKLVLQYFKMVYHPSHRWFTDKIPTKFRGYDIAPLGLNPSTMFNVLRTVYVLDATHPAALESKQRVLATFLESMHANEAACLLWMIQKKIPKITEKNVREALPDLLPAEEPSKSPLAESDPSLPVAPAVKTTETEVVVKPKRKYTKRAKVEAPKEI